jgi:hypothetical protein
MTHIQRQQDDDDDVVEYANPRGGLLEMSPPPTSSGCLDSLDQWISSSPNLLTYAVLLNSVLLFILLIVCLVLYRRVETTLDKVDSMADLNPFPH